MRTKTGLEKQRTDRESISGVIPGFDEMDAARQMAEEEELQENANRAFKILARVLKEEKRRRMEEEMQATSTEAQVHVLNPKSFLFYPESKISTLWDVYMAM